MSDTHAASRPDAKTGKYLHLIGVLVHIVHVSCVGMNQAALYTTRS